MIKGIRVYKNGFIVSEAETIEGFKSMKKSFKNLDRLVGYLEGYFFNCKFDIVDYNNLEDIINNYDQDKYYILLVDVVV